MWPRAATPRGPGPQLDPADGARAPPARPLGSLQVGQQAHGFDDARVAAHCAQPAAVLFDLFRLSRSDHRSHRGVGTRPFAVKALDSCLGCAAVCHKIVPFEGEAGILLLLAEVVRIVVDARELRIGVHACL